MMLNGGCDHERKDEKKQNIAGTNMDFISGSERSK